MLEFKRPGSELVELFRALADKIDDEQVTWDFYVQNYGLRETDPIKDPKGELWRAWEHTGSGDLHVKWHKKGDGED